jgi:valyl-tRNA synthetase
LEGYTPKPIDTEKLTLADKWILHRFNTMLKNVAHAYNEYDFHDATREIYDFTWDHYCDWYIEIAKIQMAKPELKEQTQIVLHNIFEGLMRAMHPTAPFITDELWSRTPKSELFDNYDSIMFAPYPRDDERFFNEQSDAEMGLIMKVIRSVRNIRQTFNVPASSEVEIIVQAENADEKRLLESNVDYIKRLAKAGKVDFEASTLPPRSAWDKVGTIKVAIPLGTTIDIEKTREKLKQQLAAAEKELAKQKQIIDNPDFAKKAPPEKVQLIKDQIAELEHKINSINEQLKMLD